MALHEWLQYTDRNDQQLLPVVDIMITTNRLWESSSGEFDAQNWRREEWLIRSALIPIEQLDDAADRLVESNLDIRPWWRSSDDFDFGEKSQINGIDIYSWIYTRVHPVSRSLIIDLRQDFIRYHGLDRVNTISYHQPIADLLVAQTEVDSHELYEATARVSVHRDYLRDYLAARKMGLLVSLVADRFANAATVEELGIGDTDYERIDERTLLATSVHSPEVTGHQYFRGRSILRRNFLVRPYDRPRVERSVWHYFGELPEENVDNPRFIINAENRRELLDHSDCPAYLYFKPDVLQKYLETSGYRAFFHMRNWGVVRFPGRDNFIDVGINSQGLVNAYAPHLAELNASEQMYWSSFSSLPSGEVCTELFDTRMRCAPPHSPNVVELVEGARTNLNGVFNHQFSADLYKTYRPNEQELCKLSVGPILGRAAELIDLSKILYQWMIESMDFSAIRQALTGAYDNQWKQIKLLDQLLKERGVDAAEVSRLTDPLRGLNELRQKAAHIGSSELDRPFKLLGADNVPQPMRAAWAKVVDSIAETLNSIANKITP